MHHIICRGIERRNIFKDYTDRNRFLERLGSVLQKTSTPCYGWALTKITERVAETFGIEKDQVVVAGKQADWLRARSVRPLQNAPFCPIPASVSNFNPQNTQCIPPVKIFAFLGLEQN
ncbi:MAG: hypothetical protein U9N83_18420 [Thermodesulfobacteriota bacterium]|nr:hypothetical protein [Thermodesulfobacteriota bacterium]